MLLGLVLGFLLFLQFAAEEKFEIVKERSEPAAGRRAA